MKNYTRRQILKGISAAAGILSARGFLQPPLLFAQSAQQGRNLIFVNLPGGFDGQMLFPYLSGAVADAQRGVTRPNLSLPASSLLQPHAQTGLSNIIGMHPAWARLVGNPQAVGATITGEAADRIRILKTVGDTFGDPGRSHDFCQNMYSIGGRGRGSADTKGWIARLMDSKDFSSFQVYGIGTGQKIDFLADEQRPVVVGSLSQFNYSGRNIGSGNFPRSGATGSIPFDRTQDSTFAREISQQLIDMGDPSKSIQRILNATDDGLNASVRSIFQAGTLTATGQYGSYGGMDFLGAPHNYTNRVFSNRTGFQNNCLDAARILRQTNIDAATRDKLKIIYLQRGGWDSHSNQRATLASNIADVAGGLAGLVSDLKANSLWERTTIIVFTEFGRTNYENTQDQNRSGTDHAYANFHMVLGGQVNHGVSGEDPTVQQLTDTRRNYLVASIDFRKSFSELLAWGGVDQPTIDSLFTDNYLVRSSQQILA